MKALPFLQGSRLSLFVTSRVQVHKSKTYFVLASFGQCSSSIEKQQKNKNNNSNSINRIFKKVTQEDSIKECKQYNIRRATSREIKRATSMYMCIRYMVYFIHRHPSSNCYLALCKQLRSILYVQQVDIVQLHSIISVYIHQVQE